MWTQSVFSVGAYLWPQCVRGPSGNSVWAHFQDTTPILLQGVKLEVLVLWLCLEVHYGEPDFEGLNVDSSLLRHLRIQYGSLIFGLRYDWVSHQESARLKALSGWRVWPTSGGSDTGGSVWGILAWGVMRRVSQCEDLTWGFLSGGLCLGILRGVLVWKVSSGSTLCIYTLAVQFGSSTRISILELCLRSHAGDWILV